MPVKVPRIGQLRRKLTIVYVCEHTCPILGFGTDELEVLRLLFGQLGRALARRGRNRRLGVVKRKLRGFFGHLFHDPYAVLRMTHLHSDVEGFDIHLCSKSARVSSKAQPTRRFWDLLPRLLARFHICIPVCIKVRVAVNFAPLSWIQLRRPAPLQK